MKVSSEKKTLVFHTNATEFAVSRQALSEKLKNFGIDCIFISYSKECSNYLKSKEAKIVNIIDFFDKIKIKENVEKLLEKYEKKYDIPSINLMLLADINYTWQGRKKAMIDLVKHFMFWEDFLKNNKVNFIVGGMERFINLVPNYVSKKYNVQYYLWRPTPINNHFVLLKETESGRYETLNDYWDKNKNRTLTKKEHKRAEAFIDNLKQKRERAHLVSRKPVINFTELKWFLDRAYANLLIEKNKNPYGKNWLKIARTRVARTIRKKIAKHLYVEPNYEEKYIFYPLHIETDAQILARCPQFQDQSGLVKVLSDYLPVGYRLYIKEHPNNEGGMELKKLKKIANLPNVKLIKANTHSHTLIENSKAIITVNSNAGWEGILYEKPVIVLGTAFYDISDLTYNVESFNNLSLILKNALENKKFDTEKMYKFVNAMLTVIHPGNMIHQKGFVEKFCEEENLNKVAEGFRKTLLE